MKFKSQLWEIISKYPLRLLNRSSRIAVGKDQRVNQVRLTNYANELSGKWLKILRNLPTKNWFARKATFARSRVCWRDWRSMLHAAWYPARLYKYYVECVKRNKIIINKYSRPHLRLLFVTLEVSKTLHTHMNRMKPLYTQILQWLPHYLIRSRSQYNSNFNAKWLVVWRNNPK